MPLAAPNGRNEYSVGIKWRGQQSTAYERADVGSSRSYGNPRFGSTVQILALLSPGSHRDLCARLPTNTTSKLVTVREAERALAESVGWLVVVDPGEISPFAFASLMRSARSAGARAVIYATLTPAVAATIFEGGRLADLDFVARDAESVQDVFRSILGGLPLAKGLLFKHISDRVERLVTPLRISVLGLFAGNPLPIRVREFVAWSNVPASTATECMNRAGLRPSVDLLLAVRLCETWQALADARLTQEAIAARHGFSVRGLSGAYRRFTGLSPRRAASTLDVGELVLRIARRLRLDPT